MLSLSDAAKLQKNQLSSDSAYLILLEIQIAGTDITLKLVRNTEDIIWNGDTWTAFPFTLDSVKQTSDGEIPELTLGVSNVNRIVQSYVEQANGGGNSPVIIRIVNSKLLAETEPLLEEYFTATKCSCKEDYVSFTLGMGYKKTRRPLQRYMKNFCNACYNGPRCGVSAAAYAQYPTCNHTLSDCRIRNNSTRFGGQPLIGQGGLYV